MSEQPALQVVDEPAPTDFSDFDPFMDEQEKGIAVEIKNPKTGLPTGIVWKVAGQYSKRWRKAYQDQLDTRMAERRLTSVTAEEAREENEKVLATCLLSWTTFGQPHILVRGTKHPASAEIALSVFKHWPFVFDQVWAAVVERPTGFTQR